VQAGSSYYKQGQANDAANGFSGGAPSSANAKAAQLNLGRSSVHTMQAFQGSRILHLRDRNVNTMGDEVLATSAETGATLWKYKLPGNARARADSSVQHRCRPARASSWPPSRVMRFGSIPERSSASVL